MVVVRLSSMWPENWISDPSMVEAKLNAWRGGSAQAWSYSVSHSQLLIRIYWENNPVEIRSLFLYVKDCSYVAFSSSWQDVSFTIREITGDSGIEYEISDGDRCAIRCGVSPIHLRNRGL